MSVHIPVMPTETLEQLHLSPGSVVVDGTMGGGGHTMLLSQQVGPTGRVIALDRDPGTVGRAAAWLPTNATAIHANYAALPIVLDELRIRQVDSILLDVGLSSDQLADDARGFSYRATGPLDLRFDETEGQPAWHLLEHIREKELADLIFEFGEERKSRVIARRICETRRRTPIRTAEQLADLIRSCVSRSKNHAIDPATRTFQALRIAVNEELKWLQRALEQFPERLVPGGRFVVISFHSLEDRLVKNAFRSNPLLTVLTKKPLIAGNLEQHQNPRSRSAKLRSAEKTATI